MALAIEIRTNEILFVVSKERMQGKTEILDTFSVPLKDDGFHEDFDILNAELSDAIRLELDKRDIKERYANVVLNNRMGISRILEIPKTKKKNLISIAKNELKSKLDLSHEYVVDVMRLSSFIEDAVTYDRVMSVAIKYEDIKTIETWTNSFDIKLRSLQTGPAATITLLSQREVMDVDKFVVFIDFTPSYFRIYLYRGNKYLFMRTLSNPKFKHDETNERFLSIIKVLNLDLKEKYGREISELVIMAKVESLDRHRQFFKARANLPTVRFDLSEVTKVIQSEYNLEDGYLNAIGALV